MTPDVVLSAVDELKMTREPTLRVALLLRYVMLLGSLAGLCCAFLMFYEAAAKLGVGLRAILAPDTGGGKAVIAAVMGATDACLFGVVLVIFACSIAFGFVFDLPSSARERLPGWMQATGVHELKQTLVHVILVYLVVDFATDVAGTEAHLTWESLVLPIAILIIASAMRFMSEPAAKHARHGHIET
jgi:uncharacterized membrane protein YqhA